MSPQEQHEKPNLEEIVDKIYNIRIDIHKIKKLPAQSRESLDSKLFQVILDLYSLSGREFDTQIRNTSGNLIEEELRKMSSGPSDNEAKESGCCGALILMASIVLILSICKIIGAI